MTFDPTPPSDEVAGGVLSQLGLYWDWFELQWSEWVINYDFLHQYTLAQGVQRVSRRWTSNVRQAFERERRPPPRACAMDQAAGSTPAWIPVLLALVSIAVLLVCNGRLRERLVFAWNWAWKLGAPNRPGQSAAQAASLFYQRMLRLLERAGWRKSPARRRWSSPLRFPPAKSPRLHPS